MSEENNSSKKKISIEGLMRGVLTKLGDTFDRLTGRRWTPSSSLATSELSEKLKKLLDMEVKDLGARGKFVPHNIKLKMQWDKFSTDSEEAITRLENELKIAAIDHINDNRYHTYAPIHLEVTPDYFTEGVKLLVTFEKFDEEKREAAVNVTVPQIKVGDYLPQLLPEIKPEAEAETFIADFTLNAKQKQIELTFKEKERRSVGRTKENDLSIEDSSVSKIHAALVLNSEKQLMVADTGSTNGTFINDKRIAYGRAFPVADGDKVKFGNIEVTFEHIRRAVEDAVDQEATMNEIPPENFSASQRDIQTVAFNSNEDVSVKTEFMPPQNGSETAPPKENLPETRFVALKPEVKPEVKPEEKEKTETNSSGSTQDRINYDFSNED
ncbi:MAG TPA: FHA domain-containing protein [Pyrinomonadaceae bacterium]|jgi:pSer/pThr/pTyr-binding forkhead associated (FHA) protein|nr:FHA domain-containing protein [Pyrinomonadaceae bacterium]